MSYATEGNNSVTREPTDGALYTVRKESDMKKFASLMAVLSICALGFVGCRNGLGGGGCANGNCGVHYSPSYGPVQPGPVYGDSGQGSGGYAQPGVVQPNYSGGGFGGGGSGGR